MVTKFQRLPSMRYLKMSLLVRVYLMTGILLISTDHFSESVAQCGTCVASSCSPPLNCLAGRVKDSCDCCYVCGRKEGERCDHEDVQSSQQFGRCGDTLQCRVRTDLDPYDPKEAVCFCSQNAPLCGSDGVTYENVCQLTEARYVRRNGLAAMYMGPCRKAPRISTPPLNVRNITGSRVALMCEAIGWPSPDMAWSIKLQNGTTSELPGTLTHIGVHSTSGPGHGEVTNWLLFSRLKADDDATYICSAENDLGKVTARARIYVINR